MHTTPPFDDAFTSKRRTLTFATLAVVLLTSIVGFPLFGSIVDDMLRPRPVCLPGDPDTQPPRFVEKLQHRDRGVAITRLAELDVHLTVAKEKERMPVSMPMAKVDMHRTTYRIALNHVAFSEAVLEWDWGCDCLARVRLHVKSYPARLRADETFVPCMSEALGAVAGDTHAPWRYDWPSAEERPRVRLAQDVLIDMPAERTQAAWRSLIETIDVCGESIGA